MAKYRKAGALLIMMSAIPLINFFLGITFLCKPSVFVCVIPGFLFLIMFLTGVSLIIKRTSPTEDADKRREEEWQKYLDSLH